VTDSDAEYWDGKLTELERGQLDAVANSATAWSALLGALLGVFGLVAFAGGLTSLDKLPPPWSGWIKIVTVVAAVLLSVATVAAAAASQKLAPKSRAGMTWQELESLTTTRASTGLVWLRVAKIAGSLAVGFVLAGSAVVIFVEPDDPAGVPTVVAVIDGKPVCGELTARADGRLAAGKVLLERVESITIVAMCP
jgi:hypothetical protein